MSMLKKSNAEIRFHTPVSGVLLCMYCHNLVTYSSINKNPVVSYSFSAGTQSQVSAFLKISLILVSRVEILFVSPFAKGDILKNTNTNMPTDVY